MDFSIKRLDHLGIVSVTIKDLNIIKLIDERLKKDNQGEVTQGEAVAAMILNGLGFVGKPLTLTPQFFETKPLEILLRNGITKDQLNRHKLGRTLDAIANYGCEELYNEIGLSVCIQEGIRLERQHNDTTSFSFSGEYKDQAEDAEVLITRGYSKDKRPDLKQITLELCTSNDGGVPFLMKPWSGNASDTKVFNERSKALKGLLAQSDSEAIRIADCKLYTKENIAELGQSYFITRVPATLKEEEKCVAQAINRNTWVKISDKNKFCVFDVNHYGVGQRWIVVYSQQAHERAKKTMIRTLGKQEIKLTKNLFHLQAKRFACEADAQMALTEITKNYDNFTIKDVKVSSIESHNKRGRPTASAVKKVNGYKIEAFYSINQQLVDQEIEQRSCYTLATNVPQERISDQDIIAGYKEQDCVEKNFAFLKSPSFFAAAFFMKNAKRIQAMLVIMTLSLLVYAIAQRRLRNFLNTNNQTFPNQINKPTQRPTLRWVFQCLEGINYLIFNEKNAPPPVIHGVTDLGRMILSCFGEDVKKIYQIS